ncbi:MAG: hypothetical protein ABWY18_07000 [Tardiphaga sp.]
MSIETVRRNERRKLSATLCNTVAAGLLTVGVFAPTVALVLHVEDARNSTITLIGLFVVALTISAAFHLGGRQILERLEE